MRKAYVMIIALIALQLMVGTLAFGQTGNTPGRASKSGATSGKVVPAVQTTEGERHPSNFSYPRLYCTPDGNSHWENVTIGLRKIDFAPPASPIHIGDKFPASSTFFGGFEAGWGAQDLKSRLYHPAPAAQFIIVLKGEFAITATDGETRQFRPGDVFRVEDTPPCKGHITVVGEKTGFFLFAR